MPEITGESNRPILLYYSELGYMANLDTEHLAESIGQLVREALIEGKEVDVPGLGTFRINRRPSEMEEDEEGQIVMRPPRDEVEFLPTSD